MGFRRRTNASGEHPEEPAHGLCAGTITRVAQQKHDPERASVFIDDQFAFSLTFDLAAREGLKKGTPLSTEAQRALLADEKDHRARVVALNFVGYQARTVEEVRRKLREKGYGTDLADDVIQHLADYDFLEAKPTQRPTSRVGSRAAGTVRVASVPILSSLAWLAESWTWWCTRLWKTMN